jgi:hypothetical protein|tara:strand:+ start:636 stop:908 length:273 start_codon:yes stop_codon:yes gene_type:complete
MAITSEQIVRAIKIINADATFTFADVDLDTLVWNEGTTPISKSDIEAKLTQAKNEMDAEIQAKIDKKASGKQKLKDLGLDDDEIKALTGA